MRKILLSSILTSILVIPAFSANPINDSNNDGQIDEAELAQTSSLKTDSRNDDTESQRHINVEVAEKEDQDLQTHAMGMHRKYHSNHAKVEDHSYSKFGKVNDSEAHHIKAEKEDSEDDNPNLANLTTPEQNIKDNLSASGEDAALSRQMMLDGPQGGIQNNQPPGIGGN
ncbi:hypothetical protein [Francisella sp. LA112445]|uniref:hypothetical protein n=1 Tax=Francisella sp. LA112445 TaxID=1395624 RepID=UPI001788DACF|nr:hypothetical protein [Francisella sp. LA112445]QIW10303.1 hypothetical protein FIP56_06180 [Francisella sp. LA112445]